MRTPLPDDGYVTRPAWKPYLLAALAYTAGWLFLVWPWASGAVTVPWDAKAQFLPQIQFMAGSFVRGESPAWNPYIFSGTPQIADPQSLLYSPPFVLLALLNSAPGGWAADMTLYLTILASGLFLIAWFRDREWHPAGAALAAIAFGFGAAMAWRIQHYGQILSLSMLPPVLWTLDRALDGATRPLRARLGYGLMAGIFATVLVLGRDQVALLGVYTLVAYTLWRLATAPTPLKAAAAAAFPLTLATLAGLALVALPILLTLDFTALSNRPAIDLEGAGRGSLHPVSALTLFTPDLFGVKGSNWDYWGAPSWAWHERWGPTNLVLAQNMGQLYFGAVPLLLMLTALGSGALFRREIVFFTAALAVMSVYALGWYTPLFGLAHTYLPGVSLYRRPADAVFLIGFFCAILAGYSAHLLLTSGFGSPRRLTSGIALAAASALAAFATAVTLAILMNHTGMAAKPLLVALAITVLAAAVIADVAWLHIIRPIGAAALLIGATVADLAYSNGPGSATGLPPAEYAMLEPGAHNSTIEFLKSKTATNASPTRRDRVELAGLGFPWPNASMTHRLENTLGYNPVRLGLYSQATGAGDTVGLPEERRFTPMFESYQAPLANLLGLAYIASSVPLGKLDPQAKPENFPLVAHTPAAYIYENPRVLPRVVFAPSAAPADFDAILNTGRWPDADLTGTVLLSPDDERDAGLIATRGPGTVAIKLYTNTRVDIEVDSTRGGFVVLHDLWHPWWKARIDGAPAPLLRANVLFRAVRVPPGKMTVSFTFEPATTALMNQWTRLWPRH